jgi:hypothetical protein
MSVAIANQLFLAYLGRPADAQWRSATANLLNGNQPSVALQTSFYNAAVAEGVFSTTDSNSTLVNKIFLQTFGFAASSFEQTAWGNLISNGTISIATAAWTIFSSYLGASNVPAAYQQPAQSKLIALGAYTDQLANDSASNLALSQGGGASTIARSFVTAVTTQGPALFVCGPESRKLHQRSDSDHRPSPTDAEDDPTCRRTQADPPSARPRQHQAERISTSAGKREVFGGTQLSHIGSSLRCDQHGNGQTRNQLPTPRDWAAE